MEFKKRTIIWEENTEPPKNYYWVKPDNKIYEFSVEERKWVESEELTYTPKEEGGSTGPVEPTPENPETPTEPAEPTPETPTEPTDPEDNSNTEEQ